MRALFLVRLAAHVSNGRKKCPAAQSGAAYELQFLQFLQNLHGALTERDRGKEEI